eukprot:9119006-Lingulodinium_polyedra.AAC.1
MDLGSQSAWHHTGRVQRSEWSDRVSAVKGAYGWKTSAECAAVQLVLASQEHWPCASVGDPGQRTLKEKLMQNAPNCSKMFQTVLVD